MLDLLLSNTWRRLLFEGIPFGKLGKLVFEFLCCCTDAQYRAAQRSQGICQIKQSHE